MVVVCPKGEEPRFKFKTFTNGKRLRLTFCGDDLVETKKLFSSKSTDAILTDIRR